MMSPALAGPSAPAATAYQRLLAECVYVVSRPGAPLVTRVDYHGLHTPQGEIMLDKARDELLAVDPSAMNPRARLAWAVNTYNFLVIESIVRALPPKPADDAPAPPDTFSRDVTRIRVDRQPLFEAPVARVAGTDYSLDAFERAFVFAGFDRAHGGPPPRALDPRAHFALVCGARGCPPLRPRAYTADSLDAELEAATRGALASPAQLRFDAATGRLQASQIFSWYAADFGGSDRAFAFVHRYAPDPVRREIDRRRLVRIDGFLPWDWSLNELNASDL